MMPNYTKKEVEIMEMYYKEVAPKWVKFDPDTETFYLLPNAPEEIKRKRDLFLKTVHKAYNRCIRFDF